MLAVIAVMSQKSEVINTVIRLHRIYFGDEMTADNIDSSTIEKLHFKNVGLAVGSFSVACVLYGAKLLHAHENRR